jgi:hypothetical protein
MIKTLSIEYLEMEEGKRNGTFTMVEVYTLKRSQDSLQVEGIGKYFLS